MLLNNVGLILRQFAIDAYWNLGTSNSPQDSFSCYLWSIFKEYTNERQESKPSE